MVTPSTPPPPAPPPPRRASSSATPDSSYHHTSIEDDENYHGIDMLLANSLSELNEITKFDSSKQDQKGTAKASPSPSSPPPPAGEPPSEGRRKSLFAWGTK